jgi:periplasmic protein CpxP/Spy
MTKFRNSLMAAALLTGAATIGLAPAMAQTGPAPAGSAAQSAARHHEHARMMPGQLVDGRIAFLKTELKITPAQEGQWQQFADVMRQNAQSLDQAIIDARQHRGAAMNVIDRMDMRAQFSKIRADNAARLVSALRPLYASLSPEQQQVANQLMSHDGWHHGFHHRA